MRVLLSVFEKLTGMPEPNFNHPFGNGFLLILTTMLLTYLVIFVLVAISHWKLFKKANIDGWKALIPIYSDWIRFKIAFGENHPKLVLFFVLSFVPIIGTFVVLLMGYKFGLRFSNDSIIGILYCLFPMIVGFILAFSEKYRYFNDSELDKNHLFSNF